MQERERKEKSYRKGLAGCNEEGDHWRKALLGQGVWLGLQVTQSGLDYWCKGFENSCGKENRKGSGIKTEGNTGEEKEYGSGDSDDGGRGFG
ncbi:hypothetical protein ACH5RR_034835 [Cinchona calisaya]|uniref:Uncharacterized protein n=1 Tax=Cinchona calisaya TaxID=153742 RepID=A0ABD2YFE2_9GENT